MQYQVFVQNLAEQRFVALVMGMPTVSEYGATEEEAVSRAKAALETQLARGKLITIELLNFPKLPPRGLGLVKSRRLHRIFPA